MANFAGTASRKPLFYKGRLFRIIPEFARKAL